MRTIICENNNGSLSINKEDMDLVISELSAGRLIVYPTETVYGIGCDPFDETAVKRLFMAKRRPFDMAMSIIVQDIAMMKELAYVDDRAVKLINEFMPGPLTLILPKKPVVPSILTSSSDEIGIRIPDSEIALSIVKEFGPIVSTSANMHSHKSPLTCQDAINDLGPSVSLYIDGGPTPIGKPSTIIQLTEDESILIRSGSIPKERIEAILNE